AHDGKLRIVDTFLKPEATVNPEVVKAIAQADLIVIGPGDIFTSIIPNLVVDGAKEAIAASPAKVIYICNLMTKYGQTNGFSAKQHVECIEQYLGTGIINAVITNDELPNQSLISRYADEGEIVQTHLADFENAAYKVISADVLASGEVSRQKSDVLKRSFIRHDPHKLAKVIHKTFAELLS